MKLQLDAAQTALVAVLAGQQFDRPEGGRRDLQYFQGELPDKRETPEQGQDVPFCLLQPGPFELSTSGAKQGIVAKFVLFSAGTRADGLDMVNDTIIKLQDLPGCRFTPCKLLGAISGDPVEIEHPFYTITINLTFKTV